MSKKKKNDVLSEVEKHEAERRSTIAEFNMNYMGKYWIDPDKIPTDEDIEAAKKNYEDAVNALQEKKDYVIADAYNSLRVANFLKTFIEKTAWSGRVFVGVCNFSALMEDFINGCDKDNPQPLVLDYAATQFVDLMLENYGGVGIESARWMAEVWEEYLPIYDHVHGLTEGYKKEHARCEELRDVWATFEQGYYLVVLEQELDEEVIAKDEITSVDVDE
jgi:hypothetical protein